MKIKNVLSCFDGMSCGQVALERAGIEYENYFASEVDKYAIQIAMKNFPNTVQLGSITEINPDTLPEIDLLIGGSPCQGFSVAGAGLNFSDPRSKLFFEFIRLMRALKKRNPNMRVMLENVKMKKEWVATISRYMAVEPVLINSALVSAQNRQRYYWCNWEASQPEDKGIRLVDILEESVKDVYYHSEASINYMNRQGGNKSDHWQRLHHSDTANEKAACVVANFFKGAPYNVLIERNAVNQINPFNCPNLKTAQPKMQHRIYHAEGKSVALTEFAGRTSIYPDKNGLIRRLTPVECERLQTVPDNYTEGVSDTQRYKMLGNGWTVDVITHLFNCLK